MKLAPVRVFSFFSKSSKAAFTIAFFAEVSHNYDHKQITLKHRNSPNGSKSTNHRSQTMIFWTCVSKFLFPKRSAKMIVSSLLNFRDRMFLKSAVTIITYLLRSHWQAKQRPFIFHFAPLEFSTQDFLSRGTEEIYSYPISSFPVHWKVGYHSPQ